MAVTMSEQTLAAVEMDGFAENEGVIMIAATNRPDILTRPPVRRFDRQIQLAVRCYGREAVLKYTQETNLDDALTCSTAQRTSGFSGADPRISKRSRFAPVQARKKSICAMLTKRQTA